MPMTSLPSSATEFIWSIRLAAVTCCSRFITVEVWNLEKRRLSKKVGGEAKNSGGDFGGDGLLTLGDTLGEKP